MLAVLRGWFIALITPFSQRGWFWQELESNGPWKTWQSTVLKLSKTLATRNIITRRGSLTPLARAVAVSLSGFPQPTSQTGDCRS